MSSTSLRHDVLRKMDTSERVFGHIWLHAGTKYPPSNPAIQAEKRIIVTTLLLWTVTTFPVNMWPNQLSCWSWGNVTWTSTCSFLYYQWGSSTHTHTFGVLDCLYLFVEDVLKPPVFSKKTFDACLKVHLLLVYPLVMTNSGSYEKWLFLVDLPIKHGDFP